MTSVPVKDKSLCIQQTHVMVVTHVVWILPNVMFQEFQNLNTGPSSCLSASVNRSQQARSQLSLLFIYAEGTLRMQPLHPVLLNSSAAASAVEPQSLVSCWGVQDTIRHFRFCAGFPRVITAVEFWDFNKHTERDTQPQLSLTPCSQGIGLFWFRYKHSIYREWWQTQG